jgi:hypothetical protein
MKVKSFLSVFAGGLFSLVLPGWWWMPSVLVGASDDGSKSRCWSWACRVTVLD